MHRRSLGACLVVALVVSAGCNGVLDGGPDRGTYEVPERTSTIDRTTAVEGATAPGDAGTGRGSGGEDASTASGDGGEDASNAPGTNGAVFRDPRAVSVAHARFLANRSFTVRANRTVRYANGSVATTVSRLAVSTNRTRYHLARNQNETGSDPVLIELWGNGRTVFRSVTAPDGRYRHGGSQVVPVGGPGACGVPTVPDPTYRTWIYDAFADTEATGLRRAQKAHLYLLHASGDEGHPVAGVGSGSATEIRMEAVIDASGLVRYLWVTYRTTVDGGPADVTLTLRFGDVGSTVVETRRGLGGRRANPSDGVCPPSKGE